MSTIKFDPPAAAFSPLTMTLTSQADVVVVLGLVLSAKASGLLGDSEVAASACKDITSAIDWHLSAHGLRHLYDEAVSIVVAAEERGNESTEKHIESIVTRHKKELSKRDSEIEGCRDTIRDMRTRIENLEPFKTVKNPAGRAKSDGGGF